MADNVTANSGSGGATFATASGTWSGDTANFPGCFLVTASGSEGAWTFTAYVGGAGAVTAGTQRVTLASDDPAVTSLAILDDWDESDRAKVNLIVGQAGIAAGAGAVGATVPRVTLASDDPGVALLTTIDADTGSILTAVQLIDDAVYTDGTGTPSKGLAVMGTDGTNPQLLSVTSAGLLNIADGSGSITVDGTVAATQSGTWNVGTVTTVTTVSTVTNVATIGTSVTPGTSAAHLGKAEDASHSSGDTGVAVLGVRRDTPAVGSDTDGDYSTFNFDSSGRLWCNVNNTVTVASHAVTNVGTFAVQIDGTALTRLTDIETNTDSGAVVGNGAAATAQRVTLANDSTGVLATVTTVSTLTGGGIAHDSADSGNPHKIGAKASTSLSGLTLVANGDRTDLYAGIDGVPIVRQHCNLEDIVRGLANITDGSSTSVISAAGAGVKIYIAEVIIANSSASNVTVDLRDGTAGSVLATFSAPATGGCHKTLSVPIPFSANTAVAADPSAAASTVTVTLVGFKSKI